MSPRRRSSALSSKGLSDNAVPLSSGVGSSRSGTSHLHGNGASKGTVAVVVGNLDQADVALAADGAGAGGARGDGEGHGEVDVDVGGALADDAGALEQGADVALLGDALGAVAVVAGHIGGRGQDGAGGELAGGGGVQDSLDGAAAVRGDGRPGATDGVGHLGESASRKVHGGGEHGGFDLAGAGGLAEAVGGDLGAAKDGGVGLSLGVGACGGDDGALDGKASSVAASVTGDDCYLAVGGDEGRSGKSEEEDLGEHFGWLVDILKNKDWFIKFVLGTFLERFL